MTFAPPSVLARQRLAATSLPAAQDAYRADWAFTKASRLRPRLPGIPSGGAHADWHIRSESDFLKGLEFARFMLRNNPIVAQMIERAVVNTVQNGFGLDPQTGDKKLDADLWEAFHDWATDPRQCEFSGQKTFVGLEEAVFRTVLTDGDLLLLPQPNGALEIVESHRLRTPKTTVRNVVHGVLLDPVTRQPKEYWVTKEDVDPWKIVSNVNEMDRHAAVDEETGEPIAFHIKDPKRVHQTRGLTALAPVFDFVGMFDDLTFAALVAAQIQSCVTFIRKRGKDYRGPGGIAKYGEERVEMWGAQERVVQEMAPGLEVRLGVDEDMQAFSPNVPSPQYFQHTKQILQLIGLNLGLPLVLLMLDASETNFSGWRGAVDQARMGFRRNQRWLIESLHRRVYRWKLLGFCKDPAIRAARKRLGDRRFFAHAWNAPRWSYIQPLADAEADDLRLRSRVVAPRDLAHEQGRDHDITIANLIADNKATLLAAIRARNEIQDEVGERVDYHELLYIPAIADLKSALPPAATPNDPSPPAIPPPKNDAATDTGKDPEDAADSDDDATTQEETA